MDVLDKYKQQWKNQPDDNLKVTKDDIYRVTLKKSSSIVKWIFIIGVIEFLFWSVLSIFTHNSKYMLVYKKLNLSELVHYLTYFHYAINLIFLILFFKNYKTISVIDNTNLLTKNILKVRKTVQYYMYYNLITLVLFSMILYYFMLSDMKLLKEVLKVPNHINDNYIKYTFIIIQSITILVMLGLMYLIYRLVYGNLLKKLKINYTELSKLEK